FGGIHALPSDLKWISPKMKKAMDRSDRLVLEVVGLEDSAEITKTFQQLGNSPGQPPLADRLPPELRDKGEALRAASRLSPARFETLESWAAAISLAGAATANLAMVREEGVERVLAARYRRRDKPVIGLETPARQFTYFDQLDEADQRAMLESVIADADNAPRAYRDMVTAWLKGEPEKLAEAANRGLLQRPQIRERILVRRNRDWAAQIEDLLNLGARPFVAVGAAHLAGDDSVQALLEAKGYKITRVQ
ncbi:MAG: TraB/GumN family protein, partial [Blastomonas sp.]|nr:TraB/GumN family protein [Blastomonas sp.]